MNRYIILLFLLSTSLVAETVILKSGKIIKGKVINQNVKLVEVKVDGKVQTIDKTLILKVVYRDLNQEQADKIKKEEELKLAEKQKKEELAKKILEEEKLKEAERLKKEKEEKEKLAKNKEALPQQKLSRSQILWRSAVLPGWGQIKDGRNEGYILGSGFFISALAWYKTNKEMKSAVKDYGNLQNPYKTLISPTFPASPTAAAINSLPFERQQNAIDRHYREGRNFAIISLLFYGFNLFDAWYFYKGNSPTGKSSNASIKDVMWRSAVLPGWGQIKDGRRVKGYLYGSIFLFSVVNWYSKNHEMQVARKYQSHMLNPYNTYAPIPVITDPVLAYYYNKPFYDQGKLVDKYFKESKRFAFLAVAVYLINLADAYLLHSRNRISTNMIFDISSDYDYTQLKARGSFLRLGYSYVF